MAAKTTVSKIATKAKAAPTGLQLTTAQQAAYNKAYAATATAVRTRLALASAAQGERKYRLQAANATVKKYQAAHTAAQTAAIAAHATRQTWVQSRLAHQNAALQSRIELNMYNHASLAGRLQYIAAGEKAYAHAAVMRTLDTAQATAYEANVFKAVAKTAKKASKSTVFKAGPNTAAIAAAANAAGLKAAKKVPASAVARTAPNYGNLGTTAQHLAIAMYEAHTRTVNKTEKAVEKIPWLGDDDTPNCVIIAVANHLLHVKGVKVSPDQVAILWGACNPEPSIEEVLWTAYLIGWPGGAVRLHDYRQTNPGSRITAVAGYKTDGGDHAALSLGDGRVVSWGKVTELTSPVEEAWDLTWQS
jgi:hypothetical protein